MNNLMNIVIMVAIFTVIGTVLSIILTTIAPRKLKKLCDELDNPFEIEGISRNIAIGKIKERKFSLELRYGFTSLQSTNYILLIKLYNNNEETIDKKKCSMYLSEFKRCYSGARIFRTETYIAFQAIYNKSMNSGDIDRIISNIMNCFISSELAN